MSRSEQAEHIADWLWDIFRLKKGECLRVADDPCTGRKHEWNRRGIEAKLMELLRETDDDVINKNRMTLKIGLVFSDWQKMGKSIYSTEKGVELSKGDFHSGTIFDAEIRLYDDASKDFLRDAIEKGYQPVFYVISRKEGC